MELSVVIPTRDKLKLLQKTLLALGKQNLGSELWEVIVVDDASSDNTVAWLKQMQDSWGNRLRVVSCPENVGRARARNLGADKALGRWLLFLDDDIVSPPDLLQSHLDLLTADPLCGVIGMVVTEPVLIDAPHFQYIDSRGVAKTTTEFVPSRYLVTQNTSVPRDAFVSCGGFDARFTAYGFEDMELGFRLEDSAGLHFRALRHPIPVHIHHHDLDTYLLKKTLCGHGSLQLINKLYPARMSEMKLGGLFSQPRSLLFLLAWLQPGLKTVLGIWPCDPVSHAPNFRLVYDKVMDLTIFTSYCQGVLEYDRKHGRVMP